MSSTDNVYEIKLAIIIVINKEHMYSEYRLYIVVISRIYVIS